jgi:hypothetical protein
MKGENWPASFGLTSVRLLSPAKAPARVRGRYTGKVRVNVTRSLPCVQGTQTKIQISLVKDGLLRPNRRRPFRTNDPIGPGRTSGSCTTGANGRLAFVHHAVEVRGGEFYIVMFVLAGSAFG